MSSFGQQIRQLRQRKGISLNEFAKEISVSPAYLSNLETGKTQTIHLEVLSKLQDKFQIFVPFYEPQTDPVDLRIVRVSNLLKELIRNNPNAAEYLMNVVEDGAELFKK